VAVPDDPTTALSAVAGKAAADADRARVGVASAVGAFVLWGLMPIYFRWTTFVPALEIVAHRVLWSLVFVVLVLLAAGHWRTFAAAFASRANARVFLGSAALITVNWTLFIWAIYAERVLDISLGYFINPLVSVLLGWMLLGERLRPVQWAAVALAAAGAVNLVVALGVFPWIGLTLACSFALYGLIRKVAKVDSLVALGLETAFLSPLALGYLLVLAAMGAGAMGTQGLGVDLLLLLAGPVTAVPLLLFGHGARRLSLSAVGLLQYISPSMQFFLAVFWWNEPFTTDHIVTFALIWTGLAVYSQDSLRRNR
jgi:chloramphenicol-sensitive protein RarD